MTADPSTVPILTREVWRKVAFCVMFSLVSTLVPMYLMSWIPGLDYIPLPYWILAIFCSSVLSGAVTWRLAVQSARLQALNVELSRAHAQLQLVAEHDQLTQLLNRGTFLRRIVQDDAGEKGWLLVLDLDRFKSINDRFGHAAGDAVLRAVSAIVRDSVRVGDLVGRMGGEEFAICLPHATRETALMVAERIRTRTAEAKIDIPGGGPVRATVSIGLIDYAPPVGAADQLRSADLAMYEAKRQGRNLVRLAS